MTGEFRAVTPAIVAGLLAGGSQFFNQPDVQTDTGVELEAAVDEVLQLVIAAIGA